MDIDNKFTKVSMFLDGELPNSEMNQVEKIIDTDDEAKSFIIDAVKANSYSKSFFKNEMPGTEIVLPDKKRKPVFKLMLQAASVLALFGIGILMGHMMDGRATPPGIKFADNIINPAYQNVLNTVLEKYKSGVPYTGRIPEMDVQINIVPEKTYKSKDRHYIRKFVIIQGASERASEKNSGIKGFAERKGKDLWEIKTLEF